MRFKLDENLPLDAVLLLREAGHDAVSVLEQDLGGEPDDQIAAVCREERRALVTLDLDFANIRAYPPREGAGIIVIRLAHQDRSSVLQSFRFLLGFLRSNEPQQCLWIVEETRVRIRE